MTGPRERETVPLVGRASEVEAVEAALRDPKVRAVIAHGPSGVGKSALLRYVLDSAGRDGALVGTGKYPEGRGGHDLEPLIIAVEAAVAAGLNTLYDPDSGVRSLAQALGDNVNALATASGGLLRSLSSREADAFVTAQGGEAQVGRALLEVVRWLEGFGAPVLLLIDDWGRGGWQARRAFSNLLTDRDLSRTRLLLTERDDEPADLGPVVTMRRVPVGLLDPRARLGLADRALGERRAAAAEVLAFLGPAAGRPFDLLESTRVLVAADALVKVGGVWRLDAKRAASALAGEAAVSAVRQALATDSHASALAQLLAVHGDGADAEDLFDACGAPRALASAALQRLIDQGLVRLRQGLVEFAHDRLRAEVLLDLSGEARNALAGELADSLRRSGATADDEGRGMTMLWLKQEAGLADAEPRWWRDAFTAGAVRARKTGDRAAAERFVDAAMQLAARGAGETYALLAEAALVAITQGRDVEASQFADRLEVYATTAVERAVAEEMRVFARRAAGDLGGALDVARAVLARRGVRTPSAVTRLSLVMAMLRVWRRDPRRAGKPLDAERLMLEAPMMRALNGVGSLLFERDPHLVVILISKSLSPDVIYGTAAGAGTYALLCCAMGDYKRAAAWAQASERLQRHDQPLRAIAKQYAASFGHVFMRPRRVTRSRGDEMAALAYAEGDLAVAAYGNRDKVLDALFSDDGLPDTLILAEEAMEVAHQLGEPATILHVAAVRQFIHQISEESPRPWRLEGQHFDAVAQLEALEAEGLANVARAIGALEALLGVAFGAYGHVARLFDRPWPRFAAAPFQAQSQLWTFATALALYRSGRRPKPFALWNLRRLSALNPGDFRHRWLLLAAERARVAGQRQGLLNLYREAVEAGADSGCLLEHGVVAMASAEAAEMLGAAAEAERWRQAARGAWRRLGAKALVARRLGAPGEAVAAAYAGVSQALAAAERADQAKSRLLATVGHELRTPLQSALSLIDQAQAHAARPDLPVLRHAIGHLAGLVEDLTDLGALEGGVLSLRKAPFDVTSLVTAVVGLHQAEARRLGRAVTLSCGFTSLWVLGDQVRLGQILGNLIVNGLRHGAGTVSVSVDWAGPSRLTIAVGDQGPAPSAADQIRMFEPFDRGGARESPGLGVGLFLSRRLARAMGGDLVLRDLGQGKAFVLDLEAVVAPAPEPATGALHGVRVLLVDDVDLTRSSLAALLAGQGGEVIEAESAQAALRRLAVESFDLLLLDQRLGDQTGLDVAARALARSPQPRVLLMTGETSTDLVRRAQALGVDRVLAKPVAIDDIARAATDAVSHARLEGLVGALGADAQTLIAALKPAVESEIAALTTLITQGDAAAAAARIHRLQGLAAHFGVVPLVGALANASPQDAGLPARLSRLLGRIDWPEAG